MGGTRFPQSFALGYQDLAPKGAMFRTLIIIALQGASDYFIPQKEALPHVNISYKLNSCGLLGKRQSF